jgi:hypothetical protein
MPRAFILLLPVLLLTSCSEGEPDHESPERAKRLVIPSDPAPVREAPKQPEGAEWSAQGDAAVVFAAPGQPALLTIACEHRGTPGASLRFTRFTRAEEGAKAFFAIEGNGHVARLKLDVVRSGDPGEWQGTVSAFDEAVAAIKGGEPVAATLPGGGTLRWPASAIPGALLDRCQGDVILPSTAASTAD